MKFFNSKNIKLSSFLYFFTLLVIVFSVLNEFCVCTSKSKLLKLRLNNSNSEIKSKERINSFLRNSNKSHSKIKSK